MLAHNVQTPSGTLYVNIGYDVTGNWAGRGMAAAVWVGDIGGGNGMGDIGGERTSRRPRSEVEAAAWQVEGAAIGRCVAPVAAHYRWVIVEEGPGGSPLFECGEPDPFYISSNNIEREN